MKEPKEFNWLKKEWKAGQNVAGSKYLNYKNSLNRRDQEQHYQNI